MSSSSVPVWCRTKSTERARFALACTGTSLLMFFATMTTQPVGVEVRRESRRVDGRRKPEISRKAEPEDTIADESRRLIPKAGRKMQQPTRVEGWVGRPTGRQGSWRKPEAEPEGRAGDWIGDASQGSDREASRRTQRRLDCEIVRMRRQRPSSLWRFHLCWPLHTATLPRSPFPTYCSMRYAFEL